MRRIEPVILLLVLACVTAAAAVPYQGTVITRSGDRHTVANLDFQGRDEIEVYVDDVRRLLTFDQIDRLRFGELRTEEIPVVLHLRSGDQLEAVISTGGGRNTPSASTVGGARGTSGFTGTTQLGPFYILLEQIAEIRFAHEGKPESVVIRPATVVDLQGRRFEVNSLRYRGRSSFDYQQDNQKRTKEMERITTLEFEDVEGQEIRPVVITFVTGRQTQGTVDAGTVRLSGETDAMYRRRVVEVFTGSTPQGPFAMGLHQLKLIRFNAAAADSAAGGDGDEGDGEP
ncbi:MAG: hypothetical protein HOM68_03285 [Gemmatimonadetes bacterium]|jgi:hypothetical protein|nr:hypothetical protein [Gemmatimonadota bacterium]MBT5141826.1 hypothetical protein [Gemmatimonadota bacterium]MBT5588670.1 hypothetical protein [Gemmatimonadota bacterium]MBT5962538.1 hypothetical protein [Gemmatimonadota bacterium]MBT7455264.1 hypothetical protein [Gemmatimonadota bacterium]